MPPERSRRRFSWAWLLLAGGLQALCFAPGPLPAWSLPFVQIASLAVLSAHAFAARTVAQAARYGWLFGLAQFGIGVYWLVISMHRYGGLALPLAIAALLLFAAAMALYPAAACALTARLGGGRRGPLERAPRQILNAALWACAWTLTEWLRGTLFTGFTWLNIGYAHAEGMFAAWAPFVGVYGIAWLAAFAAGAVALMARAKDTAHDRSAAAVVGLALISGLLGIAWSHIQWAHPHGAPLLVRLVQPATPLAQKFDHERFPDTVRDLLHLATLPAKDTAARPDLIVFPETALPIFQDRIGPDIWRQWRSAAQRMDATLLLGVPLHNTTGGKNRYTNAAVAIHPGPASAMPPLGQPSDWHYDKHHLVPFGEFIPPGFHWFVRTMNIPLGDFDRGALQQTPLMLDGQAFAVDICYEDTFGEEIAASVDPVPDTGQAGLPLDRREGHSRHRPGAGERTTGPMVDHAGNAPAGASILVNISNLAWFGNTWALRQHLWMARMRALETARPVLRATNTGMTAAIGPHGDIRGALEPDRPGVLDVEVQGTQGLTPYVRWKNIPILVWSLLGLLWSYRRRPRRDGTEATPT